MWWPCRLRLGSRSTAWRSSATGAGTRTKQQRLATHDLEGQRLELVETAQMARQRAMVAAGALNTGPRWRCRLGTMTGWPKKVSNFALVGVAFWLGLKLGS